MITFKQFLVENTKGDDPDFESIANAIKENCSQYINSSDLNVEFWRGMSLRSTTPIDKDKIGVIGIVRKDRRPRDSSYEIHDLANDFFKEQFGVAARSESLFVVKDQKAASMYVDKAGMPTYRIFPIGEYRVIWSSIIKDLFDIQTLSFNEAPRLSELIQTVAQHVFPQLKDLSLIDLRYEIYFSDGNYSLKKPSNLLKVLKALFKLYGDELYVEGNLNKLKNSKSEIMVICDKFIAVEDKYVDDILNLL